MLPTMIGFVLMFLVGLGISGLAIRGIIAIAKKPADAVILNILGFIVFGGFVLVGLGLSGCGAMLMMSGGHF